MAGGGDPRKVVKAALLGNGLIAISKFVAFGVSGSIALLAEAVHSVADTCNQALLLLGMGLSERSDPDRFPLGRAAERYFWAFVVSLVLFFLGGVYAIYEGAHKLAAPPEAPGSPVVPLIVLSVSVLFEGSSFMIALREFKKMRGDKPFRQALLDAKDPTIPVVLLEDAAAVFGLLVAMIAVISSHLSGTTFADGVGSITIGVLLCSIGVVLIYDTHSLIIGESATPAVRQQVYELTKATDGVEEVTQLLTMHLGPQSVLLALKVRFRAGCHVEDVERITDQIERRVREQLPEMKNIFVEADSDFDPAKEGAVD